MAKTRVNKRMGSALLVLLLLLNLLSCGFGTSSTTGEGGSDSARGSQEFQPQGPSNGGGSGTQNLGPIVGGGPDTIYDPGERATYVGVEFESVPNTYCPQNCTPQIVSSYMDGVSTLDEMMSACFLSCETEPFEIMITVELPLWITQYGDFTQTDTPGDIMVFFQLDPQGTTLDLVGTYVEDLENYLNPPIWGGGNSVLPPDNWQGGDCGKTGMEPCENP